ncbi:MAG: hypothetical protein R3Y56_11095 [Akkermansia sp.]
MGAIILAALHLYIAASDPELARKISYTGFCVLLFGGGVISWLMARKGEP